jgi:hypothetical protein
LPLGPSPLQILQQVLSGNYSAFGVPTLEDLMNNAGIMDAEAANNPMDRVIEDYSLLRLKQNWWKWAVGYSAKVGVVKLVKPAASTVGFFTGLSTLMMLGSTMLDAVDPAKLPPPPPDPTLQLNPNPWVPGPNGTLVLEIPWPQ